ncbi:MAG TPA: cytochrome C oxidase subunit I [Candidatus Caldiarchaeum subterraneum]|uniref:Cytochrome C oxidase subunit I n=1 Tax=Caldiarchaeum subterraneum TaxID=311458 RepID=A0A832ZVG7_CALS0|nr:cytochrome C oxidase subunit I [Candidatus Caldarchaeum subterraneum]
MGEIPRNSLRRWLFTTNHKDIGILYLVTSLYFLVAAGALALLVRIQLTYPNMGFLTASAYNQAITVHGVVMLLWFLSPIAFALANYIVPLQIGARDLAFPRLNAMSYWLLLFGGLIAALGFFTPGGAIDTGWTVYAPLNTAKYSPQPGITLAGAGLLLLMASVTLSTVNFLVTIFRMRVKGLSLLKMPMFTWGILLTVFLMLLAFPPFAAAVLMLASDRILGTVYFLAPEGGALLWTHLLWFFGHPEVYILLFPALFALGDVLVTFTKRPIYGKKIVIAAAIAGSVLSLMVWGHHMFTTGINPVWRKIMTVLTETISIPFGVIILAYILTLVGGRIRLRTPMLFALGSIALFIIGGITGVFNSSVAIDYGVRGTYWIVGHFHFTLVGGATTALVAAIYYWWPKMSGRMFSEKLGKLHFTIYMIGYLILYLPMHALVDMPRRVYTYPAGYGWELNNLLATIGAFIFALSWPIFFLILYKSLRSGEPAGNNPWGGWSLEWLTKSPPPPHNYDGEPVVDDSGTIRITTLPTNGGHAYHEHYSPWPITISLAAFLIFLGAILFLPVAVAGLLLLVASVVGLAKEGLAEKFKIPEAPEGARWPFTQVEKVKLGVWMFLYSEAVLFGSLIGSYVFVRLNSAAWPAPGEVLSITNGAVNTFILLTSSLTAVLALASVRVGNQTGLKAGLLATFILGLAFLLNKAVEWNEIFQHGFTFSSGLPAAAFYITTGAHGAHVAAGLVVLAYIIAKAFKGGYTRENHSTVEYFGLYWHFVDIVWVFLFPLFYLI